MVGLGVLEHLEGGADQLVGVVHRGSFHKLQAVLVHDNAHPSLLKHPETRTGSIKEGTMARTRGSLIGSLLVIIGLVIDDRKLVLEARASSSLHVYSQVLSSFQDLLQSLHQTSRSKLNMVQIDVASKPANSITSTGAQRSPEA